MKYRIIQIEDYDRTFYIIQCCILGLFWMNVNYYGNPTLIWDNVSEYHSHLGVSERLKTITARKQHKRKKVVCPIAEEAE